MSPRALIQTQWARPTTRLSHFQLRPRLSQVLSSKIVFPLCSRAKDVAERKLGPFHMGQFCLISSPSHFPLLPILPSPPVPLCSQGNLPLYSLFKLKIIGKVNLLQNHNQLQSKCRGSLWRGPPALHPRLACVVGGMGGIRGKRERCPHLLYHGSPPESGTALKSGHLLRQLLAVHSRGSAKGQ